jgi:biofilm PGA synthesis N-glycosyltransferase PgaC
MVFALAVGLLWSAGVPLPAIVPGFQLIPEWWGLTLTLTYLAQASVSHFVERRYEPRMMRGFFWIIWYPMAFWLISTLTTVAALPRVLVRPRRSTWESPDRGLR